MKNRSRKIPEERFKDRYEDLKADNKKLRKQVSQLQKENARLRNRDEGLQDLIEEFGHLEQQEEIAEQQVSRITCGNCHSRNVKLMSLRHENSHYNCVDCGKTGPVK